MNPRILKKLSKRAAILIDGKCRYAKRYVIQRDDREYLDTTQRVDRKHYARWSGTPNRYGYFAPLKGTIVYGDLVGYYEPEWSELDAYSLLVEMVVDRFTDWNENAHEVFKVRNPAQVFSLFGKAA